jgi:predicted enzyme related to lactoylglutathione lyase
MALDFQVTVDCADPHTLADWWAEVLGWDVEPSDPAFIAEMISKGLATEADTTTHRGVTVWKDGAAIRHPEPLPSGRPRRMLFQTVPEAKTVKNRVHWDIWVGAEQIDAERVRLEAMGATFLHTARQGPHSWVTMADPEGNEFCVA